MSNYLAPDPIQSTYFIPGSNTPGSGVQIFMYAAGTTTKQTAYQDSTTSTPWSNPIVLDAGGNLPTGSKEVWLVGGQTYKAVYAPANDTDPPASPYRTADNLSGVNDPSGISTNTEWIVGTTSTFISTTSFSVVGDQTALYTVGRRVKATVTAGTVYGSIVGSSFATSITTVTVRLDSGALDSGLLSGTISYGLLNAVNPSIPTTAMDQPTQTVTASSTTLNLASTAARSIIISSTNPVSTMPIADGQIKFLAFSGALTLTTSATFLLPGNQNIPTAAGDTAIAGGVSASTRIFMYQSAKLGAYGSVQVFTSTATYTSPAGLKRVKVTVVGAGGGSGGCAATNGSQTAAGGGGGGGGASIKTITASTVGASQTVTVGAGGTAGASGGSTGGTGGTSSFGALLSATGGTGGTGGSVQTTTVTGGSGGPGGTGSSGDVNITGQAGGVAINFPTVIAMAGLGGSSILGGGAQAVVTGGLTTGISGGNYGGGASGAALAASQSAAAGSVGAGGIVIVEEFF